MKKTLLAIGAVIALSSSLNAQIFVEDWSTAQASTWTAAQMPTDTDTNTWGIYTVTGYESQGPIAISNSWISAGGPNGTALTPDNLLISPPINLSAITGNITLSFKIGSPESTASGFYEEFLSVYVVTDPAQAATATPVHSGVLPGGEEMFVYNYSISSMAGQAAVYLVFRHHNCTDENFIMLDDIAVVNSGLSVDENIIEAAAYPNPANNVLNLKAKEDIASISVLTMDGKVVATAAASSVDVEGLNAGMYIYEAVTVSGKVARGSFAKN